MKKVSIKTETIELDKFLKWSGAAFTGGEVKILVSEGLVKINGRVETHRSKKLVPGDVLQVGEEKYTVVKD